MGLTIKNRASRIHDGSRSSITMSGQSVLMKGLVSIAAVQDAFVGMVGCNDPDKILSVTGSDAGRSGCRSIPCSGSNPYGCSVGVIGCPCVQDSKGFADRLGTRCAIQILLATHLPESHETHLAQTRVASCRRRRPVNHQLPQHRLWRCQRHRTKHQEGGSRGRTRRQQDRPGHGTHWRKDPGFDPLMVWFELEMSFAIWTKRPNPSGCH